MTKLRLRMLARFMRFGRMLMRSCRQIGCLCRMFERGFLIALAVMLGGHVVGLCCILVGFCCGLVTGCRHDYFLSRLRVGKMPVGGTARLDQSEALFKVPHCNASCR